MHKAKKKTKTAKIPKPIKIKKEKTEEDRTLHSMSHYMDDRLELVKQIFGSLKPKTITNLAPDFLKKKNMDEIQEMCLNELLGISTKRLLSIINATKCPTDTESDEDSDVQHKEEHVSLEEISSDSEIEGGTSKAAKKKLKRAAMGVDAKKDAKNSTEKDAGTGGGISVLELLELQARARAIRSQLALEPVTKIEVDSDVDETDINIKVDKNSKDPKHSHSGRKRTSSEKERSKNSTVGITKHSKTNGSTDSAKIATAAPQPLDNKETEQRVGKKIKLKRNYRTTSHEQNNDDNKPTTSTVSTLKEVKREGVSRSVSPDVIPIVAETVTLLISDSSDEETSKSHNAEAKKGSTLEKCIENTDTNVLAFAAAKVVEENKRQRKITEPEEGEISETDSSHVEITTTNTENIVEASTDQTKEAAEGSTNSATIKNSVDNAQTQDKPDTIESNASASESESDTNTSTGAQEKNDEKQVKNTQNVAATSSKSEPNSSPNMSSNITSTQHNDKQTEIEEDDQNDDVISIEGGDLESEMIEHLEEESTFISKVKPTVVEKLEPDDDIISLESSEDERGQADTSESWHTRYLKSSKVSKVLAASRLSKRVRDKLKKSKRTKKDSMRSESNGDNADKSDKPSSSFTSKHEDGSVEQYKELQEIRQRKT